MPKPMMAALFSHFERPVSASEDACVGSFGDRLQREREMRRITLEEIAEATKIGTRALRALEQEDFDKLPGGIFNKGFVRAYARYLGLDEDQAVADYQTALADAVAAGTVTRQDSTPAVAPVDVIVDLEDYKPVRLLWRPVALTVVMAALLFAGWRYYVQHGPPMLRHARAAGDAPRKSASSYSQPVALQPPPSVLNAAARGNVSKPIPAAAVNAAPSNAAQTDGFVLRVKIKQKAWISIIADGKQVISGELPADAEKTIHARQGLVLKTGNAGGVELFHNDMLVPPLGASGEVKTVEFTAAGLRR